MNQLININPDLTMSSLEIVKVINTIRKQEENNTELMHKDFLEKAREVLGERSAEFSATYVHPQNKQTYPCYNFPKRESMLMAMSYSYTVQAAVYDAYEALNTTQSKVPTNFIEAMTLALEQAKQIEQQTLLLEEQKPQVEFANDVLLNIKVWYNTVLARFSDRKAAYSPAC